MTVLSHNVCYECELKVTAHTLEEALAFAREYEQEHWSNAYYASLRTIGIASIGIMGDPSSWRFKYHIDYGGRSERDGNVEGNS